MAFGVMAVAEEYGLRIPDDLALVGFDDIPASAHMQPALTTVRQPFYEMGQRAIDLLLSLVDSPRPLSGGMDIPRRSNPQGSPRELLHGYKMNRLVFS